MKRFLSVLICVVLVCSFAGCGESKEEQERIQREIQMLKDNVSKDDDDETETEVDFPQDVIDYIESTIGIVDGFLDGTIGANLVNSTLNSTESLMYSYYEENGTNDIAREYYVLYYHAREANLAITGYYLADPNYTVEDIIRHRDAMASLCGLPVYGEE